MTIDRHWLMTGAAVIAALGLGFAAARLTASPAATGQAAEDHHEETAAQTGVVVLTPQAAAQAGVTTVSLDRGGALELMLPGRVEFVPGAEAVVDAPLAGTVIAVHVGAGSPVAAGTPLVTLRSPEGAAASATVDSAAAAAEAAVAAVRRDAALFERGYVARARLDITQAEARRAEAELRAARARLSAYGSPTSDGRVVVRSPIAGVVTRLVTSPGQVLHQEDQEVATVADARRIELVFKAPPAAAALLKTGQTVSGRTPDGKTTQGVIEAIAPAADDGVVVVRARVQGAPPPAGAVVSARISGGGGRGALTAPAEAVQNIGGVPSIFVVEDGGFRAHPVVTGKTADGRIEILSGLDGAERIAGPGAFLLKAELAKGQAEHEH